MKIKQMLNEFKFMQGFESWVGIHVDGEAYYSCPRERLPSGFLDIDYLKTDRVLDTYYEQPVEILVFYVHKSDLFNGFKNSKNE